MPRAQSPVSVVIPTHSEHRLPRLVRVVQAVREQSPPPAEIIVVVDHNPHLHRLVRRELPDVTVLDNRLPRGVSGNRNTGARHAVTPVVVFLDDDVIAQPGWLAGLCEPLADPAVVGTGGGIAPDWETLRPTWLPDEFLWTVGVSRTGPSTGTVRVRNVWSASMAVRRDAFEAVQGFRTDFGKVGDRARPEDTEFCLRLTRHAGGHWVHVSDAVVVHPVPAERATLRAFLHRCVAEGRGKVAMARLLDGGAFGGRDHSGPSLDAERGYLLRTLPRAVLRGLAGSLGGRGAQPALRAGAVLLGATAAGVGALVELASPAGAPPVPPTPVDPDRIGADR
ncbi:glycosyltransferase [Micromonospora sp. NPDC047793]|uniref:glycosyltransferase family 2 protein n=2 Tax=unclassified Micromonospora TaxID=2617518 RepID=UPI0033F04187